jgi:aerobic C4-dicarboxylate transport protein
VVGLVIPTGYSFNLDGTSIYLTMAAVFIAQATNSHMDIFHQITLLVVLLLSSKGAAGVTGSGFIVLAATISAVGICRWRAGADSRYRPLYVRSACADQPGG